MVAAMHRPAAAAERLAGAVGAIGRISASFAIAGASFLGSRRDARHRRRSVIDTTERDLCARYTRENALQADGGDLLRGAVQGSRSASRGRDPAVQFPVSFGR